MLGRRVGASITPEALVGQCVVGSLGAVVVAQLVLGWPAVTATMGALALVTPLVYWTEREEHRRVVSQAALVDAIGQLRAGLGSRRTLGEALAGLAVDGPPPLRDGFVEYARDASLTTVDRALMLLRERLADPIGDTLVATLLLAERLGGGAALARVLEQLAATSRRKLRARQEAAAAQTRLVWSARVVALIPLIVLVLIRTTSPGYLAVFDEPTGQVLLATEFGLRDVQVRVDVSDFGPGGTVRASAAYTVDLGDLPLVGWVRLPVQRRHAEPVDLYRSFSSAGGGR